MALNDYKKDQESEHGKAQTETAQTFNISQLRLSHALRNDARLVGWSAALLTHGVRRDRRGLGGGQNGDALGIPLGDQK